MLIPKPPMGWNSWNTFGPDISDELIRQTADVMAEQGFLEAGYNYLVIDDCWSERERDENGRLVPDKKKFPNGMKAVADYVHSKGLKFGMYSCAGIRTCADYPGSYDHEFIDAETFAEWGVDYLKYDFCTFPHTAICKQRYQMMSMALKATGRDILFSACNWGVENPGEWMRSIGAGMYRSTGDIFDKFESYRDIFVSQIDKLCYNAPNCFNDIDMMIVGMYGKGHVAIGGCNDTEYQTHFALWAMMNSPLIIGCDVRNMDDATRAILTNPDLIAINQDPECRSCHKLSTYGSPDAFILVKQLSGGDMAVGFFNFGDNNAHVELHFWDMGLPLASGYGLEFHDCLTGEELGVQRESFAQKVEPHGCRVYRCRLTEV